MNSRFQERLDLRLRKIADANASDLAFLHERFHDFPRISNRYIDDGDLTSACIHREAFFRIGKCDRPVNLKVQYFTAKLIKE